MSGSVSKIRARTIILGNNGTGKSTILKSIALAVAGSKALAELLGHDPSSWIRFGTQKASITALLKISTRKKIEITLKFESGDTPTKFIDRNLAEINKIDQSSSSSKTNSLHIGYGVHRRVTEEDISIRSDHNVQVANMNTLFNNEAFLYSLKSWILDMDYRKKKQGIKMVKTALSKLLPGATFSSIDPIKKTILFKNKDGEVPFDLLSDGFQLTANWIGDLLYRLTENTKKTLQDPFKVDFLLLIDEVALHLHPAWQRTIILSIESLFPNVQIIATTHSPFVAQQAGDYELFTLIRKERLIESFHYEGDPRKLLIHQIITSDIFGIPTDESIALEMWKTEKRSQKQNKLVNESSSATSQIPEGLEMKNIDDMSEVAVSAYSSRAKEIITKKKIKSKNDDVKDMEDLIKKLQI